MKQNRYVEAFKESYNLVGLATAASATLALMATPLMPIPLLVGLVAEAAYLLFYADSRWYAVRMAKKFDADIEARRAELKARVLPSLHPTMRARFQKIEELRRGITDEEYGEKEWFRDTLRKMDLWLEKWLQFAAQDVRYCTYLESVRDEMRGDTSAPRLASVGQPNARQLQSGRGLAGAIPPAPSSAPPLNNTRNAQARTQMRAVPDSSGQWMQSTIEEIQAGYNREISEIAAQHQNEKDANTAAVLERRLEVLKRRSESAAKIGGAHVNFQQQMSLLEDNFGLIADGIRARSPEQVLQDVNSVVSQLDTMTQLLDESAPYEQLLAS